MSLDVKFIQGDTIRLSFTALRADGVPINLTGASIIYELSDLAGVVLIRKETPTDVEITDANGGEFDVMLSGGVGGESTALNGNYTHEAQITDQDGNITTISNCDLSPGKVFVRKELVKNP